MEKSFLCCVVVCVALGVGVAVPTEDSLWGPCVEWVRNDCPSGTRLCTSVEQYERSRLLLPLGCPVFNGEPPTPPPGQCRPVNGVCQYAQPTVTCDVWVPNCDYRYTCGTVEERESTTNTNLTCGNFGRVPPAPDMLCIPFDDTCHWYNPCRYWRGFCLSGYQCGTADQYYQFLFGPHPLCALPPESWVEPQPLGECVVQDQECRWSNCVAYLDWCRSWWTCGTQYDEAVYLSSPPPPCPAPPPGYMPPPQPGVCRFNVTARGCQFHEGEVAPSITTTTANTPIPEDACVLGIVGCPQDHVCVPFPSYPLRAVCVRSCASNNGGCGDQQVCVERPYCPLCELRRVMNGHCEDRGDTDHRSTTTTATTSNSTEESSSKDLGAAQVVWVVVGLIAGVSVVLVMVLCIMALLANYHAHKDSRVPNSYTKDDTTKEEKSNSKYSELKYQDSLSEKDDLSISTSATDEEVKEKDGNV